MSAKKRDPRLILVDALWDAAGIADVKAVAMSLLRYLDEQWRTTTSVKSLASLAGVNEKTAREILAGFVAAGAVLRRERFGANGAQTSPEWTVTPNLPSAVTSVSEARDNRRKLPPREPTPVPPTVPGTVGGTPSPPGTAHGTPPVPPTVPPPVPPVRHDPGILIRGIDPYPQPPASGSPPAEAGSVQVPAAGQEPNHAQPDPTADREPAARGGGPDRVRADTAGLDPEGDPAASGDGVGPAPDRRRAPAGGAPARAARRGDPAGESAVWAAYRVHHPQAGLTPPKASAKLLRAAIDEYGAEAVIAVVRWAHESRDQRARFLQDNDYLGLENLLRSNKLPDRVEMARRWSPPSADPNAPAVPVADLPPAVAEDLDRLPSFLRAGSANRPPAWANQPDPDRCARLSTAVRRAFGVVDGRGNWAPLYADLAAARPRIAAELVTLHHPEAAK